MPESVERPFSVVVTADADDIVLRVVGELDVETVPTLVQALFAARRAGNRRVIVDLSRVTFMDCAGLTGLLLARRQGTEVVVVGATGTAAIVLDVTGAGAVRSGGSPCTPRREARGPDWADGSGAPGISARG